MNIVKLSDKWVSLDNVEEEWKSLDFDPTYLISNTGKVYSSKSNVVMKTRLDRYGYSRLSIWVDKNIKTYCIHKLVATYFIPNLHNLETVNHKDGNKQNNSITNLEWLSSPDNVKHAYKNGISNSTGESNPACKLTESKVIQIKLLLKQGMAQPKIQNYFPDISLSAINKINTGRTWKHIKI